MSLEDEGYQKVSTSYLELNIFPPLVLEKIFSHLGVEDLKNVRQVCSGWGTEATRVFKKKVVLVPTKVLEEGESGDVLNDSPCTSSSEDVAEDGGFILGGGLRYQLAKLKKSQASARRQLNYFRTSLEKEKGEQFPVENIRIGCRKVQEDDDYYYDSAIIMEEWVSKFGPSLRMIDYNEFRSCEEVEKQETGSLGLLHLLNNCPALEELVLSDVHCLKEQMLTFPLPTLLNLRKVRLISYKMTRDQRRCVTTDTEEFVRFLKQVFWNVKEVVVDLSVLAYEKREAILRVIIENAEEGRNLETLEWKGALLSQDLRSFISVPKLKNIVLDCRLSPVLSFSDDFYNFLERQKEGVKRLEILGTLEEHWGDEDYGAGNNVYLPFVTLRFPFLPSLTTLVIEDIFHFRPASRNIYALVEQMPALRKLSLRNVAYASEVRPFRPDEILQALLRRPDEGDFHHIKLEHLELHGEILWQESIAPLTRSFPNLKSFTLSVYSDDVFQEVFRCCSTINHLELLDMTFRSISNMSWSNSAVRINFPKMTALKTLRLHFNESTPFQLDTSTLTAGICGAPKIRRIFLQGFSIAAHDRDSIFRVLEEKSISFRFHNCSFFFPSFDISYEVFDGKKNPLPRCQFCPKQK